MVGRKNEREQHEKRYQSDKSEFVAIYGRRRVGKTYLVKEHFKDRFAFWHTGLSPYDRDRNQFLSDQLRAFHINLLRYGLQDCAVPQSWLEAFALLSHLLEKIDTKGKKVVFIDELPWMDTARSSFIPAFENFWNDWAAKRDDVMLIVCGSATSWIEDNLINSKGGLYGRLTHRIHLKPFTLPECRDFFTENHIIMSDYDIVQSYMILGGIPYYMGFFEKEYSLAQNVDRLFFAEDARLEDEFDLLFGSLFTNPEQYKSIVRLLGTRHSGYTRDEIIAKTGIPNGGGLTKQLKSLIASNFIMRYTPFGQGKEVHYKLSDSFCRFWLLFMERNAVTDPKYWENNVNTPALNTWRGIAFEELCMSHIPLIKRALGVEGVSSMESAWAVKGDELAEGAQIDLVIDRADNIVNLCEMKFYNTAFKVTKEYFRKLNDKLNLLQEKLPKRKIVHLTLVTTDGLAQNEYSSIFQQIITLEDLLVK